MTEAPTSQWGWLVVGLLHLAAWLPGGPLKPALPPCALEAVCPPAWLPPEEPDDVCPPCPDAPACPSAPAVCAAPEPPEEKAEENRLGAVLSAAPGLLVALVLEAGRAVQCCCRRARRREDGGATSPAPARRGGGVVR